jgi:hypothetical protein
MEYLPAIWHTVSLLVIRSELEHQALGFAMITLVTFGDSILDCGHYNEHGIHPGALLVRNHDLLFPEFAGSDLCSLGEARLDHRAVDGSTVYELPEQTADLSIEGPAIALLTIGGNDLIMGLLSDRGPGLETFARDLGAFFRNLAIRPVIIGSVYDPTFGDDSMNFVGIDPELGRGNLRRINGILTEFATKYGALADLHGHFLAGEPAWYTRTIEPSLVGASEIRRCFLPHVLTFAQALG